MAFKFDPDAAETAWPEGSYDAEVSHTDEGQSKKGADMLTATFTVYGEKGKTQVLKDYFVGVNQDGSSKGNLFKLRQLCAAVGGDRLVKVFKSGTLNHEKELRGQRVTVKLAMESSTQFGDQNKIDGYSEPSRNKVAAGAEDDDVPF